MSIIPESIEYPEETPDYLEDEIKQLRETNSGLEFRNTYLEEINEGVLCENASLIMEIQALKNFIKSLGY